MSLYGPSPITDYVTPSTSEFLEEPTLVDPTAGVVLDEVQKGLIAANHDVNMKAVEAFYLKAAALFDNFYYGVKDAVLKKDSLSQFYMNLYGHADGCLRQLARTKAAQVFKPEARKAAVKETEDKPSTGLLDGDENLASKLQENNKVSDLINQVLPASVTSFYDVSRIEPPEAKEQQGRPNIPEQER